MFHAHRIVFSSVVGGFNCYVEKVSLGVIVPLTTTRLKALYKMNYSILKVIEIVVLSQFVELSLTCL